MKGVLFFSFAALFLFGSCASPVKSLYKGVQVDPVNVRVNSAYRNDPTIVAGEASNMVSRDAPGQTALERTIIRWAFDSDPRGVQRRMKRPVRSISWG